MDTIQKVEKVWILKFNNIKAQVVHNDFLDIVYECIQKGDKDFEKATFDDEGNFLIENRGFFKDETPKNQAYRRGITFKERLKKKGHDVYFQIYWRDRNVSI